MNFWIALFLAFGLVFNNGGWSFAEMPQASAADSQSASPASEQTAKPSMPSPAEKAGNAVLMAGIGREYPLVSNAGIGLKGLARRDAFGFEDRIPGKIRAKYIPVELVLTNTSGKLLKIPTGTLYFSDERGHYKALPTEDVVYRSVKRRGILRACLWGVPIGVVSFGFLLGPAVVASGVHTKITNGSMHDVLSKAIYRGGHLPPEGKVQAFAFVRKTGPDPKEIILGRVINLEDQVETEVRIPIIND